LVFENIADVIHAHFRNRPIIQEYFIYSGLPHLIGQVNFIK